MFAVGERIAGEPLTSSLRNRKLKRRAARECTLPVWDSHLSAGAALLALLHRVHGVSGSSWRDGAAQRVLFPISHSDGSVARTACSSRAFVAQLVHMLRGVGMPAADLARVTGHSLRAGSATDYFEMGLGVGFIRRQCGWTGESIFLYHRPQLRHRWSESRRLFAAMQAAGF